MPTPRLFKCIKMQLAAIRSFQPEVIVGSSFGAIVLQILIQRGLWKGPYVILSPAMSVIFPHRSWIPKAYPGIVVYGARDHLVAKEAVFALAKTALLPNDTPKAVDTECEGVKHIIFSKVHLFILDDEHSLSQLARPSDGSKIPNLSQLVEIATTLEHQQPNSPIPQSKIPLLLVHTILFLVVVFALLRDFPHFVRACHKPKQLCQHPPTKKEE
ncbi:hypothetical protein Pelo_3924 [Pelomyxa schiedti]|nr:hypothetical protein Pelo_3924 [Pelomyxa schiedti]